MSDRIRHPDEQAEGAVDASIQIRLGALAPLIPLEEARASFKSLDARLSEAQRAQISALFERTASATTSALKTIARIGTTDPVAAIVAVFSFKQKLQADGAMASEARRTLFAFIQDQWFLPIQSILEQKEDQSILEMDESDEVIEKTDPAIELFPPDNAFVSAAKNVDKEFSDQALGYTEDTVLLPGASLMGNFDALVEELERKELVPGLAKKLRAFLETISPPLELSATSIDLRKNKRFFGVFDGAGRPQGGRIASRLAAFILAQRAQAWADEPVMMAFPQLRQAVEEVNKIVTEFGRSLQTDQTRRTPEGQWTYYQMATTACVAQLFEQADGTAQALIANAGDSQAYQWNASTSLLFQITKDNMDFLGYDGAGLKGHPKCYRTILAPGDKILLMSDGIEKFLDPTDIAVNIVLARWENKTVSERIIDQTTVVDAFHVHKKPSSMDDKSLVEIAFLPEDSSAQAREEARALVHETAAKDQHIAHAVIAHWRGVPWRESLVHWQLLRFLYPLKSHKNPKFAEIARFADQSTVALARAYILLEHELLSTQKSGMDPEERILIQEIVARAQRVVQG